MQRTLNEECVITLCGCRHEIVALFSPWCQSRNCVSHSRKETCSTSPGRRHKKPAVLHQYSSGEKRKAYSALKQRQTYWSVFSFFLRKTPNIPSVQFGIPREATSKKLPSCTFEYCLEVFCEVNKAWCPKWTLCALCADRNTHRAGSTFDSLHRSFN